MRIVANVMRRYDCVCVHKKGEYMPQVFEFRILVADVEVGAI